MSALLLMVAGLLAQALPGGNALAHSSETAGTAPPDAFVIPGFRIHVYASEDLDPDSLGAFARPGVVLWLETRSNMLRPATLERLKRFQEAWVECRTPLKPVQLAQLARARGLGIWIRDVDALPPAVAQLGLRRIAVDVKGEFTEERFERLVSAAPWRTNWLPEAPSVGGYAHLARLGGVRTLRLRAGGITACPDRPRQDPHPVSITAAPAHVAATAQCGFIPRVPIEPTAEDDQLRSVFRAAPSAELEVQVGADDRRAMATRRLIERLELASATVPARTR